MFTHLLHYLFRWAMAAASSSTPRTISELTEPDYLPTPSERVKADAFMASDEYASMRAADALPTLFADDPVRAVAIWRTLVDIMRGGSIDDRTHLDLMRRLSDQGIVVFQTDEYPTDPIVAEPLAGQILGDGRATSNAPNYLSTTMGHKSNLAGEVRTYRASMPIVDSFGNGGEAHELVRSADTLIRMFSADGSLDGLELIGTQDQAFTGTGAATSDYKPNGGLRKATPAAHGTGAPDAWHVLDTVDHVVSETGKVSHVPRYRLIEVGNQFDADGRLTFKGSDGRTESSSGKCRYPMARMAGDFRSKQYREVLKAQKVWTEGVRPAITPKATEDIRGCFDARTLNVYRTSHDGKVWHGWTRQERSTSSQNQPTSSRVRKARSAARTPEQVNAAQATTRAAEMAMALFNAHCGKTPNVENHAPIPNRFTLVTETGLRISIGLKLGKDRPTGFRVEFTSPDGSRKGTSTSAPEYVEAIVRNRLALLS